MVKALNISALDWDNSLTMDVNMVRVEATSM